MKTLRWSTPLTAALLGGAALAFSGCASKSATQVNASSASTLAENGTPAPAIDLKALNAAEAPGQPRIVTKDYSNVRVTGSLIPTKMPTDPNSHPLPNANPVRTMTAEEFERIVNRGLADRH